MEVGRGGGGGWLAEAKEKRVQNHEQQAAENKDRRIGAQTVASLLARFAPLLPTYRAYRVGRLLLRRRRRRHCHTFVAGAADVVGATTTVCRPLLLLLAIVALGGSSDGVQR